MTKPIKLEVGVRLYQLNTLHGLIPFPQCIGSTIIPLPHGTTPSRMRAYYPQAPPSKRRVIYKPKRDGGGRADERIHQGKARNNSRIFGKLGVPLPVTGSHPRTAAKPDVPHPGLLPEVISFKIPGNAYKTGLMNPTGLFHSASRASLIKVIKEPTTGLEADVPKT